MTKVMIVDDNNADQFLLKAIIEEFDQNMQVMQAYDGEQALAALEPLAEDDRPRSILLDINMPVMDGFEFLDIYSKFAEPKPVIIMLSSSDQEKDKEKAFAYNCVKKYCIKPLSTGDLALLRQENFI